MSTDAVREGVARTLWMLAEFVAPPRVPDDMERVLMERVEVRGGNVDIALSHSIVKEIAGHMATWFDTASDGGPGNYVEVQMRAPDGRAFTMTMQNSARPTPHELRQRAEARVRELEGEIRKLRVPTPDSAVESKPEETT